MVLSAASWGDQNQFQLHFVQIESKAKGLIFNTSDGSAGKPARIPLRGVCVCKTKDKLKYTDYYFFSTAAPVV